jgi:predicted RND superfamily exporter protein
LAGPLESARSEAQRCAEVAAADATDITRWNRAQHELMLRAHGALRTLRESLGAEPPSLDNLPEEIRQRFLTRSGDLLGFIYPEGDVFEPSNLEQFVAASRRVAADATGFPLLFHKMARRITTGFYRSIWVGAILVTLILLLDLRRLDDTLLALLPLVMGMIWMLGGMRLLGLSFNFANLVAIPLIIGVGIDNGVHVIHRVRLEHAEGMDNVLRHTGRAILISSLTTMIGFGSLSLASHRGMASLGVVLLLGVGSCLLASLLVLPNLLVALGRVER